MEPDHQARQVQLNRGAVRGAVRVPLRHRHGTFARREAVMAEQPEPEPQAAEGSPTPKQRWRTAKVKVTAVNALKGPSVVERVYEYSQHGDRMYGGTDKMLRFFQYSLACIGCKMREDHRSPRARFAGRQIMAVKHEIDRGRIVSRFFGVLDELRFLSTQSKGRYLGAFDWLLYLCEWGTHTSLIGYYVGETIWWFLQTCPEVDRSLGPGNAWVRRWDGASTWSFRWERWCASCSPAALCCERLAPALPHRLHLRVKSR